MLILLVFLLGVFSGLSLFWIFGALMIRVLRQNGINYEPVKKEEEVPDGS